MAIATGLAIAAGGAGLGMQLKGQYEAGKAAQAQAESEAAWNIYNARLAERDAQYARQLAERRAREEREAAAVEEAKLRKGGERLKATQRARYAKAGITFEGTPEEVLEETATELEIDALMIRRGGQQRAGAALYGGEAEAYRYTAEAALSRLRGKSALLRGSARRRASRWRMADIGLTGASRLGYQYNLTFGKKAKPPKTFVPD